MASWQDELAQLLKNLGVTCEQPGFEREETTQSQRQPSDLEPTYTCFQHSRHYADVFYRVDLVGLSPELRVCIAAPDGPYKMQMYLVKFAANASISYLFASLLTLPGSTAFQEISDVSTSQLFLSACEVMKALFWKGDFNAMVFPYEIEVERLL